MTTSAQSFEASLLFAAPLGKDIASEIPELTRCLDSLGQPVETTQSVAGEYVVAHCPALQVLIAHCALPFDAGDFRGVVRPDGNPARDADALDRLESHQVSITVLVADRPDARWRESAPVKERVCWEVTDLMAEMLGAELVFWSPADTLYFSDEFAGTSPSGARAVSTTPEPAAPCDRDGPDREHPALPLASTDPNLDFLDPLPEDRAAVPDLARRMAERPAIPVPAPEEIAEAMAEARARASRPPPGRTLRDMVRNAFLTVTGVGLASYSVLNGLIRGL